MTILPSWSSVAAQPSGKATVVVGVSTTAGPSELIVATEVAVIVDGGVLPAASYVEKRPARALRLRATIAAGLRRGNSGMNWKPRASPHPVGNDLHPGFAEAGILAIKAGVSCLKRFSKLRDRVSIDRAPAPLGVVTSASCIVNRMSTSRSITTLANGRACSLS